MLTAIVGLTMIVSHFIPPFNILKDLFEDWFFIIAAFAIYLGVLNLLRVNADKIYKKQADAPFGLVVILGFLVITIPGLFFSGGRSIYGSPESRHSHCVFTITSGSLSCRAFFSGAS